MPIAKVGDINLYYEVHGKGETLVLIMGYTHRGGQWAELRDKLAVEYRVIVPDNRGTGQSDKPEMPYTANMMATDVAGLLDALGVGATNVLGYSMGGMIAQEFALNYPGRLDNLILCATHFGGSKAVWNPESLVFFSNPELAKLSDEDRARASIPWIWSKEFVENNPAAIERFVATTVEHPSPLKARLSHQNVLLTHDTYERLPDIKAPTLIITGSEDLMIPCENSKLLASRIPNAELVIIDNAGHGLFVSDPTGKVSATVLDFLRRHSKARLKN